MSNYITTLKIEAKTADELEEKLNMDLKGFTLLSVYGMNNRHYAWLQLPVGVKAKVLKQKTIVTNSKKEKVKI